MSCAGMLMAASGNAADLGKVNSGTLGEVRLRCAVACADRVFGILRENNPELTGEKRRTIMKPPQVCSILFCKFTKILSPASSVVRLPNRREGRVCLQDELLVMAAGAELILRADRPSLPSQVAREGTKKTVFTNFLELCKTMNRQLEHVQAFLLAELGTSGNLDGQSRLVVKGRFLPKAFEGVLRRYVNE